MIKYIRNLFKIEKTDNGVKDIRTLRTLRTLFESDNENCYKPIKNGNVFSSNYNEYESNGDKDKTLSIKEYLDETKPYLNYLRNDLKTQGEWKIQLTMAIK